MKLLLITSMYPPYIKGGGEISTSLLAENLQKLGVEVTVLTISEKPVEEFINDVRVIRIIPPNVYWSYHSRETDKFTKIRWHLNESFNPFQGKEVVNIIKEIEFDLIQTSVIEDFSPNLWRLIKENLNTKIVHTLRSYYLTCYKGNMFKSNRSCESQCAKCKVTTLFKKKNTQYVDHVVGISEDILNRHFELGYFTDSNESIIPNSFEVDFSMELNKEKNQRGKTTFGFIGKLDSHKGIDFLINTILSMSKNDKLKLVIAGFGPLENLVKRKAEEHPNLIEFIGRVNPHEFYKQIDVNIVPSQWNEPFGRVIIESFAYGKPVIASSNGGIPEIVSDTRTGLIFNDSSELMAAISKFMQLSDQEYSSFQNSCLIEAEKYTHKIVAEKYLNIYKKYL